MAISNARHQKKHGGTKNKGYFPHVVNSPQAGIDINDFEIPRYEEMKFLKLEDFEDQRLIGYASKKGHAQRAWPFLIYFISLNPTGF